MSGYAPFNSATDGALGDGFCMATDGYQCLERIKPPGAGRKRRYFADDVDLEQMRIRARILRDKRDMRNLLDLVKLLSRIDQ